MYHQFLFIRHSCSGGELIKKGNKDNNVPKENKDENTKDIIKSVLAASGFQPKKPKTEPKIL